LLALAETPRDIIAWLHGETTAILRIPSIKERLAVRGLRVGADSPDELAASIKGDNAKWEDLLRTIRMRPR
jgi:tripartite-type tricarboxylate transporter receptor subunit TctC